ncbi:MAG TPA: hypothetical protein VI072_23930 [Polyangiaceae bacterium]
MKGRIALCSYLISAALTLACEKGADTGRGRGPEGARSAVRRAAQGPPQSSGTRTAIESGKIPFDYPAVRTTARPGDYVLAPSSSWIAEAFEKGGDKQTFIYYGGWLRRAGEHASEVETLTRQRTLVPNAFVIPIRSGERADSGDILLTSWASGSGMQRAYAVGGEPKSPRVRYLDIDWDNPSGFGNKEDVLPANTFHRLHEPGEVGSTVACKEGARRTRWIVANQANGKLLTLGFAGRMRVFGKADCENVPLRVAVKPGDDVYVPIVGAFTAARVARVEPRIGRLWAKYDFGGQEKEEAFAFANVATTLALP